ncbi:hypothetical protein LC593_26410 [Nostoc sp. CHAB 5844]|nr:hypothetical protein [Nostoc sp. CHAB 5844]
MDKEAKTSIANALDEAKAVALAEFMGDFIGILEQKGYSFSNLLDALAEWAGKQTKYREVLQYLEKASDEAFKG